MQDAEHQARGVGKTAGMPSVKPGYQRSYSSSQLDKGSHDKPSALSAESPFKRCSGSISRTSVKPAGLPSIKHSSSTDSIKLLGTSSGRDKHAENLAASIDLAPHEATWQSRGAVHLGGKPNQVRWS